MVRSGSTWSFNVALELVRAGDPNRKTFGLFSEDPVVLQSAARPRSSNLVIKSHKLDPSVRELCHAGAIKAIYTWRDPYDTVCSCMRMFGWSLEESIQALRDALRLWAFHKTTRSACIVSYEAIVQQPGASIAALAAYLGVEIEAEQFARITNATSLQSARAMSQRVNRLGQSRLARSEGHVYDRQTLYHQGHIIDGGIGYGSKELLLQQRSAIEAAILEEGFSSLCEPNPA